MSTPEDDGLTLGLDEDLELIDPLTAQLEAADTELHERRLELLRGIKVAFRRVFLVGDSTEADRALVRENLGTFCRKFTSTFHPNTHMASKLDGRREVILRVDEYCELSVETLLQRKLAK
jgi:hypothetical protein